MISKAAVEAFRTRKLDTSEWIKRVSEADLLSVSEQLGIVYKTPPRLHQLASAVLSVEYAQYNLFHDPGLGKSKITLDALTALGAKSGKPVNGMVFVPNQLNVWSWGEECSIHSDLKPMLVTGSSVQDRWGEIVEGLSSSAYQLVVLDYSTLQHVFSERVPKQKKKGNELRPDPARIAAVSNLVNSAVFDEIHKAKNRNSLRAVLLGKVTKNARYRFGASGTPFGRDPIDLWSVCGLVDRGVTLGTTMGIFHEAFFKQVPDRFAWGGVRWEFDAARTEDLYQVLQHRSIRYSQDDCLDLPEKTYIMVKIPITPEQNIILGRLRAQMRGEKDSGKRENIYSKSRQLNSGVIYQNDENGKRYNVELSTCPKLEELISRLEDLPAGGKAIVYYEYTNSGDRVSQELSAAKIPYVRLWSGCRDNLGEYRRFLGSGRGSPTVMLSQWGLSESGINPQGVANYVFFYESPVSPISRKQCELRVHRMGQTRRVFITDFCVMGTADEKLMQYLKEGRDLSASILDGSVLI